MDTQDKTSSVIIKTFAVGPLQCNCSILADPTTKTAIVVDPGGDAQRIIQELRDLDLTVTQILHTHAHFDHFLASGELRESTGAPLCLHKEDQFLWDALEQQCSYFHIPFKPTPPPDQWLTHEEELPLEHCKGIALHTPGHTPGSMCFFFEEAGVVIVGDTLFRGAIGRTDLWGGDYQAIERSIREQLYTLDEELQVVTGHGPATSIGWEMRNNAFIHA